MHILRWAAFGLLFLITPLNGLAQDNDDPVVEKQAAEETAFQKIANELMSIRKEAQPKLSALIADVQKSKGEDQQAAMEKYQEAQQELSAKAAELGVQVKELLAADVKGPEAMDMITWIMQNAGNDQELVAFAKATLVENHLDNPKVADLIPLLTRQPSQESMELLTKLAESGGDDVVKATAALAKTDLIGSYREDAKSILEQNGDQIPVEMKGFFEIVAQVDMDGLKKMYQEIGEQFPDVKFRKSTVGKYVAGKLKAIEAQANLQVGKVAPDIEGLDIDGVNFKLSDYRGKVVMLDFWGNW